MSYTLPGARNTVTRSTKVGEIDEALEIWKKVLNSKDAKLNSDERAEVDKYVNRLNAGRTTIINYAKSKVNSVPEVNKEEYAEMIGEYKTFKKASIDEINRLSGSNGNEGPKFVGFEKEGFLEKVLDAGGMNFMTVLKGTLGLTAIYTAFTPLMAAGAAALPAGSALAGFLTTAAGSSGTFLLGLMPGLQAALGALFAINPFVAAAAVVIAGAGVVSLVRKLFAPEIKRLKSRLKVQRLAKQNFASDSEKDSIDSLVSEVEAKKKIEKEEHQKRVESRIPDLKRTLLNLFAEGEPDADTIKKLRNEYQGYGMSEAEFNEVYNKFNGLPLDRKEDVGASLEDKDLVQYLATHPKTLDNYNNCVETYKKAIESISSTTKTVREKGADVKAFAAAVKALDADTDPRVKKLCTGMTTVVKNMYEKYAESGKDLSEAKNEIKSQFNLDSEDMAAVGSDAQKKKDEIIEAAKDDTTGYVAVFKEIKEWIDKDLGIKKTIENLNNLAKDLNKYKSGKTKIDPTIYANLTESIPGYKKEISENRKKLESARELFEQYKLNLEGKPDFANHSNDIAILCSKFETVEKSFNDAVEAFEKANKKASENGFEVDRLDPSAGADPAAPAADPTTPPTSDSEPKKLFEFTEDDKKNIEKITEKETPGGYKFSFVDLQRMLMNKDNFDGNTLKNSELAGLSKDDLEKAAISMMKGALKDYTAESELNKTASGAELSDKAKAIVNDLKDKTPKDIENYIRKICKDEVKDLSEAFIKIPLQDKNSLSKEATEMLELLMLLKLKKEAEARAKGTDKSTTPYTLTAESEMGSGS